MDAADQARQEAEARRRRILEEADGRLGLVTGETTTKDDEAAPAEKMSGAARLAAMRKRRFKKAAAVVKDEKEAEAVEVEAATEAVHEPAASSEATAGDGLASKSEEEDEEPVVAAETCPVETVEEAVNDDDDHDEIIPSSNNKNQKKYMGVARMRRQKLKERQEESDGATKSTAAKSSVSAAAAASTDGVVTLAKINAVLARKTRKVSLLPILMHFVTTLLLFLAGLDVGWQQHQLLTATVHTQLAPRQLGLQLLQGRNGNAKNNALKSLDDLKEPLLIVEDEFAKLPLDDAHIPNIDPLFGLDLDQITRGDSILNYFARAAIFVHRSILQVVYYMPRNIVSRFATGVTNLLTIPPLLALVALLIRQLVGKVILGAHLPSLKPPDESEGKDVLSMVKNFVKGFALRAFPKVFTIYDAWSHLRTDMYVVLCGLIVGLALQYHLMQQGLATSDGMEGAASDYMEPPALIDEVATTGDEL
jgi:hypothetical protein